MALNGFVKIFRQLMEWEWYQDVPVKTLFLHCLLEANFKDKKWRGVELKRGQFLTSNDKLRIKTGLTLQQVRTAIKKLKSTGEITTESTNRNTIITVVNYDFFQDKDEVATSETTDEITDKQQTDNKQITHNQQLLKNVKNVKNVKNDKNIKKTIQKKDFNSLISDFTNNTEVEKAILDFIEMRTAIKKPLTTSRALNGLLNKLKPHSDTDKIKLLDEAIEKNWLSVYPRENERSIKQLD